MLNTVPEEINQPDVPVSKAIPCFARNHHGLESGVTVPPKENPPLSVIATTGAENSNFLGEHKSWAV